MKEVERQVGIEIQPMTWFLPLVVEEFLAPSVGAVFEYHDTPWGGSRSAKGSVNHDQVVWLAGEKEGGSSARHLGNDLRRSKPALSGWRA